MRKLGIKEMPQRQVVEPRRFKIFTHYFERLEELKKMWLYKSSKDELDKGKKCDEKLRIEQAVKHKPGYEQLHLVLRQRTEEKFLDRIRERFRRMFEQVQRLLPIEPPKFGFEGGVR